MSRSVPSEHGKLLGDILADLYDDYKSSEDPSPCKGCAFKRNSWANMSAATGLEAFKTSLGLYPEPTIFGCHHGMVAGQPTRLCEGFTVAIRVRSDRDKMQNLCGQLVAALADIGEPSEIVQSANTFIAKHDPDDELDDYERAKAWAAFKSLV